VITQDFPYLLWTVIQKLIL